MMSSQRVGRKSLMLVSASGACWPQLSARSEPGAAAAAAGPSLPAYAYAYEDPEVPEGSNRKLI
jgi:hypothetical protein